MPVVPTPPSGYTIQALPSFLRDSNRGTKTVNAPSDSIGNSPIIAEVDPESPTTITVRNPKLYTAPVATHEATHVYQMSRNPAFTNNIQRQTQASNLNAYDYGGVDGLLKAQTQRKTIANFSAEQQATMVADYQRMTADALKRGDRTALAKVTAAYHPFISQLASIPPKGADMTKMTQQDLTPAAPSVPPATVAGMPMLPDKLLGGDPVMPKTLPELKTAAARRNPSATGPKIGESKRFLSGKMGTWDGHGWRAK